MLIQFSVKNYLSFKDEQTLSLTMAKGGELVASNTFNSDLSTNARLLKAAVIYGANASGKSNFLAAIGTMKDMVIGSATESQRGKELPVTPFLLDEMSADSPSEFEIVFVADGVRYQYGFAATSERVQEEWLLAFPKAKPQRWFTRIWNEKINTYEWEMGNSFTGQKQLWQKATRSNALFLSTAVHLNSVQLQPVFDWFNNNLKFISLKGFFKELEITASRYRDDNERKKVVDFLKVADLGINDISVKAERTTAKHLPDDMPEEAKTYFLENEIDTDVFDIHSVHKTNQGRTVLFNFSLESEGTLKIFALAGPVIDTLENGHVLFIDELHGSLHPKMVRFLVDLFHDEKTNPNNAQLLFTSHETSILSQDVFRRDQIWFCEKDKEQATILYPLTDFSPRKGRENLEAGYLSGRYGALPYITLEADSILNHVITGLNDIKHGRVSEKSIFDIANEP